MGKPDSLSLRIMKLSEGVGEKVNKLTGFKKDGLGDARYALSHGGFSLLGLDMSKRLGLQSVTGNSLTDIMFPGGSKLADMAGAAYTAGTKPTEMNAKRLAHEVAPRPSATNMELEWFSKNGIGHNVDTLRAGVKRTPLDIAVKRGGFTGIHESVEKDKLYMTNQIKEAYADMRKGPLAKARDEFYKTGRVSPATVQKYIAAEGDINTFNADLYKMARQQNIPAKDLARFQAAMSNSITSLKHAQRLKEAYETK
jgi:hypothetical protein